MAVMKAALFLFCPLFTALADPQTQTALPGEDVTLLCQAPKSPIGAVEWTRPDLEQYVFFQRGKAPLTKDQAPTFKNRVQLRYSKMEGGDLSLILKNVSSSDEGTYECRYKERINIRFRRAAIMSDPIEVIDLKVNGHGHGRGHAAIIMPVIALIGLLILVGLLSFKRLERKSYQPAEGMVQETESSESKTITNNMSDIKV